MHFGIAFDLFQGPAHAITQRVLDGGSDIAITSPRPDASSFEWRILYVERLCLAVPPGHGLASRKRLNLSVAAYEPFVGLQKPFGLRLLTEALFAEAGIDPTLVFEAAEIPTMEGLVAAGFGVAVVPVPRDGGDSKVIYVPLSNASAKREVGLAWGPRPLARAAGRTIRGLSHRRVSSVDTGNTCNDVSDALNQGVRCIGHITNGFLTLDV